MRTFAGIAFTFDTGGMRMDLARACHAGIVLFISYIAYNHFFYALVERKYGYRRSMCIVLPFVAALTVAVQLLEPYYDRVWFVLLSMLVEQGGLLLIWKRISHTGIWRLLLIQLTVIIIAGLGNAAGRMLYVVLHQISGAPEQVLAAWPWEESIVMLVQCILLLALERPMQRVFGRDAGDPKYRAFIWILIAEVMGILLVGYFSYYTHHGWGFYLINAGYVAVCCFADWYLFRTFRNMVRSAELERDMLLLQQQQALQKDAYRNLSEQVVQLGRARHDYSNTLTTIGILLEGDDPARAAEFVRELQAETSQKAQGIWTGHQIVDAVLANKRAAAEAKGIAFHADMQWPDAIRVSDADLMSLFANLLDNAIEYCETLPAEAEKRVCVCAKAQGCMLLLDVANPYRGDAPPDPAARHTSKPDVMAHGFGLGIVRGIALRANGAMSTAVEDGMLHIRVLLASGSPPDIQAKGNGTGAAHRSGGIV